MNLNQRRCGNCGKKGFSLQNVKGKHKQPWRKHSMVLVTVDLELPVCLSCGKVAISSIEDSRNIDLAIETSIKRRDGFHE